MYISQPVATLAVIQAGGKIDGQQVGESVRAAQLQQQQHLCLLTFHVCC